MSGLRRAAAIAAAVLVAAAPRAGTGEAPAPADSLAADSLAATVPSPAAGTETYVYVAESDDGDRARTETHRVEITRGDGGSVYRFEIARAGTTERGWARVDERGGFLSAARRVYDDGRGLVETDSAWVEGARVVIGRTRDGKTDTHRADLEPGRPLAVDVSLILWFRYYPLGDAGPFPLLLGDWSKGTIDAEVRDLGVEAVEVPAGTFDCHKMQVTIKVLVFRPKITFWVTADEPHFLVRHAGKRGPRSPVFVTRLVQRGLS